MANSVLVTLVLYFRALNFVYRKFISLFHALSSFYRFWPQYVRERLQQTYGYLAGSLGITAMSAVAASRSPAVMNLVSRGNLLVWFCH